MRFASMKPARRQAIAFGEAVFHARA
jgi:hypothetical protein